MKLAPTCLMLTSTIAFAACGGSSTSTSTAAGFAFEQSGAITVPELNSAGNALTDFATGVANETITGQSAADLAAAGSASYRGYLLGEVQSLPDVIVGRTTIDATFTGGGSVSGSVSDMVLIDGTLSDVITVTSLSDVESFVYTDIPAATPLFAIPGTLTLAGGAISDDPEGATLAIDVTGTATVAAAISITDNEEVYNVEGTITASVGNDDTLIGAGELKAESNDAGFDLDAILFAR